MDLTSEFRKHFTIDDGVLKWKQSGPGKRKDLIAQSLSKRGYYVVCLRGRRFYVHRVIFAMIHGYMPNMIDHVDGDKTNNAISNLRPACHSLNGWNTAASGASGVTGVHWDKQTGKWKAAITVNGRNKSLGRFASIDEAHRARLDAQKRFCYDFP